jgi:hypothetical protein
MTEMHDLLDKVFAEISQKYADNDDEFIELKHSLLYVYDNEAAWRSAAILKLIKPKHWYIDQNGDIHSVERC